MRQVKFEYKKVDGTSSTWYPDDISKFKKTKRINGYMTAEYYGELSLEDYDLIDLPAIMDSQMSKIQFFELLGDENLTTLLTIAKTDIEYEVIVFKIVNAEVIDFDDPVNGPQAIIDKILADGYLTQEEADRIKNKHKK